MIRACMFLTATWTCLALLGVGCATVQKPPEPTPMPASLEQQREAQQAAVSPTAKIYKRKVAIGRFSNESTYGRGLLLDTDLDPLGKQASDILATMLEQSNRFLVFERPDLSKIEREQKLTDDGRLVGVDALILGSITEFGRATEGETGFLSSTKRQRVRSVAWKSSDTASSGQTCAHVPHEMHLSESTRRPTGAMRPTCPRSAPSGHKSRHHSRGSSHDIPRIAASIASTPSARP